MYKCCYFLMKQKKKKRQNDRFVDTNVIKQKSNATFLDSRLTSERKEQKSGTDPCFVSITVHRSGPAVYMGALEPGGKQSQEPLRQCHRLRPLESAAVLHRWYVWSFLSLIARIR